MAKKNKSISNRRQRRKIERNIQNGNSSNLSPERLLYRIKYELTSNQSEHLLNALSDEKFDEILGNKLPKSYKELRKLGAIYPNDEFNKELIWYKNIIVDYIDEINQFLELQKNFESAFIKGDYITAKDILSAIEKDICVSHWTIDKRLLLSEYQFGFKNNKETLTQIISDNENVITDIFAKYHSIRIEKDLSYLKYCEMLNGFIYNYTDAKVIEYLNYKLNVFTLLKCNYKGFILNAESSSSVIDMYIALMNIITFTISQRSIDNNELNTIKEILSLLEPVIYDNRIKFLLFNIGKECTFNISDKDNLYFEILNHYTIGNYSLSKKLAEEYLLNYATCFELYEIYTKSCIHLNESCEPFFPYENSIANNLVIDLYNVLQKNDNSLTSLYNIHKVFNTIGLTSWSYKAFAFFNNQHSIIGVDVNIHKFSHLYGTQINPILSLHFNISNLSIVFLNNIKVEKSNGDLINFWSNVCSRLYYLNEPELPDKVQPFRKELYYLQVLQAQEKFDKALEGYILLESGASVFYNKEEIIHGKLYCYLNLSNIQAALELVTESNLENQNLHLRLRSEYLINHLVNSDNEILSSNISSPIFLHQYQKYISPNDLWVAYDNFLNSHGLNYPHEIELIKDEFDPIKLVYFLKNICKQEVFDSSYLFENQDELDNERIEICLILSYLDRSNFEDYINEISEISRNQLIRKGIKQIDESKIYVDVKGVKKSIEKDLKESFYRSQNLLSIPLSQIEKLDTSKDNVIVPYYGKSAETNKVEFTNSNIKITTYSRFGQFKDMFFKLRDMFIASNEFGIDTYLSMRIRHGTLLGEIRSVFENHQLITKKVDNSETYQNNSFWLQKIMFAGEGVQDSFNKLMSDFSAQIDGISGNLKNKSLQISTEKKATEGLFDYSFFENELLTLFESEIGAIEEYDEFFDTIIKFLWERTEINLAIIREEISNPIKSKINKLLSDLAKNLEQIISKIDHPELNELLNSITFCQTDIANELDKISEWFRRTNNKVINEFYLDLPIDASLATLKRFYKGFSTFNPTIVNNCNIKFEGDTFPHFTYIMQNLFDNIFKHAKLPPETLEVNITINEANSQLSLIFENNFSDNNDIEETNKKIENTRQLLLMQTHDRTRTEDGTGYLKIKKTIVSDLSRDNHSILIHDVDERKMFKTELIFDISTLQKNTNENIIN